MANIVDKLKTKVGPLPIFGWVLIVVAAVVIARWYMGRTSGASSSAATTPDLNTPDPSTGLYYDPATGTYDLSSPSGSTGSATGNLSDLSNLASSTDPNSANGYNAGTGSSISNGMSGLPAISNDIMWTQVVSRELDAEGYQPGIVSLAIAGYFANAPLPQQEYSLMELAIEKFGQPPDSQHTLKLLSSTTPVVNKPPSHPGHPKPTTTAPSTPSGFTVKASGDTITLSWKASRNAAKYRVTNAAGQLAGEPSTTSLTLTGKTPGRVYAYKVAAVGTNGKASPYTVPHTVVIPLGHVLHKPKGGTLPVPVRKP